ncbi:MAG: 8-amino-7-oxononanoate synthase [Coxiella sp. RIFCSPHIGHO2_12_FULL_44_14]|nr:MAG: 8-amino-7-oxononanoate synthase [Coxiella sp. RIFCSPHIGHO2_12_FULL_44_14]
MLLTERLKRYRQRHWYRTRYVIAHRQGTMVEREEHRYVSFSSNDYLGLAEHPEVVRALQQGAERYGVGSSASAMISGYTRAHEILERAFATFFERERALLFSSGYLANLGVLSVLADRQDTIFMDRLAHASLIDAAQLSRAKWYRYAHLNYADLSAQMCKHAKNHSVIVSDGVFSMDGDWADVRMLATLARQYQATLIIDDAHGVGVLGKTGRGVVEHFALQQKDVPILIVPLGKALGGMGAIVAGSTDLIEGVEQLARTYRYDTALSPAIANALLVSLQVMQQEDWRREKLNALISVFQQKVKERELPFLFSSTPIQILVVGDEQKTLMIHDFLLTKGCFVSAIRPPTVPLGSSRLRITLHCEHTEQQIDYLLNHVAEFFYASHIH